MQNSGLLEAFMALRPSLLRYLSLQGAAGDEAEDIVQEVGLKLTGLDVASVAQPRAYLYRMAHNLFLLNRRTEGRRFLREEAWSGVHSGDPPELDEEPSIEARLVAREQLALVQGALNRLPERTRDIFRRYRLDGVSQRQIAVDTGISVSAVEKHLARAYQVVAAERFRLDEVSPGARSLSGGRERHES
ncbi:MAG TPA: RNA polymerase sigma factor [Sphingobium sp.]|uniref:RNA polymerase sigma factor n=1 Tax=Sphingobium sp. TaxID=1912891 RepID=UPI002ED0C5A5